MKVSALMGASGTGFGTSGVRGLAAALTDQVSYVYTRGFTQYLEEKGDLSRGASTIAVAGDLRPSTERIIQAVCKAIRDDGYEAVNTGLIPSPAIAHFGIQKGIPTVMVTGSHIPADRNGIKYNKAEGEILKSDEAGIKEQEVSWDAGLFTGEGAFAPDVDRELPAVDGAAEQMFIDRYINLFPRFLDGTKIALYAHSAVGRDMLYEVLTGLGADVEIIGESKTFIPVDTEAIRPEDVVLTKGLAGRYFAIVSTDGDSDRPLIAGSDGIWLRGDVLGILASQFCKADAVVTPVSCNTAAEKCRSFARVVRTKIGSPYVIEGMMDAAGKGAERVVGYEANGGFLTATDLNMFGGTLPALPTRDSFLPILATLWSAKNEGVAVQDLVARLPQRFTASDRIKNVPQEKSRAVLALFGSGRFTDDAMNIENYFGRTFGTTVSIDYTDGVRITFQRGDILHLRPSGNAPEFRCYTESSSEAHAREINAVALNMVQTLTR